MECSLRCCGRASLLFYLGLFLHCGEAQVLTEAQAGPLYRAVGTPLSISCNVSGFSVPGAQQEFEFRIKKAAKPTFEINIISTSEKTFGYAMYADRVKKREIVVTRVSPTSVLFEILSLEKDDEGDYDCSVINSEVTYHGVYSVQTTVKVIDNSLSVSSPASEALSYEGEALTLTCQASSNTVQHTHLSVAWLLRREGVHTDQPIISMDRDFTLIPGPGFEGRYKAGLVRLDKMGEATYTLQMDRLELSDRGQIYCRAKEWIQDPDRSWYSIVKKDGERTTLNVKAREVVTDKTSLAVTISTPQSTLQEGQGLTLSCHVAMQDLPERFFSVAWLRGDLELARIGPTGVLSVGSQYTGREQGGELRATRVTDREYRLVLQPVRTEDQGGYICRSWPQERGQGGAFTQGAPRDSRPEAISISATESGLSVEMQNATAVNEGDRLELTCKVRGVKDGVSVAWQRESTSSLVPVAALSREGVMERSGEFRGRGVKATRTAADTFTLELDQVRPSDSGVYRCDVSEWKGNSKTNGRSQTAIVSVRPVDSLVRVNLICRAPQVAAGGNVELMCRVRGPRLPMKVTWSLQRGDSLNNILTMSQDGAISWSADVRRYQLRVDKGDQVTYYLFINGASDTEAGKYQCSVSVFLDNEHKKVPPSNLLAVSVQNPVSKLRLASAATLIHNVDSDIVIRCSVKSATSQSSRYAVTWRLDNKPILSSDKDALVTVGAEVEPSLRQRISMERIKGPTFVLSVRQAQTSDQGSYVCEVEEFLKDHLGEWYPLSPVSTNTAIKVMHPEKKLSLVNEDVQLNTSSSQDFAVPCHIANKSGSESAFRVTWFRQRVTETEQRPIFTAHRDSTLEDEFGRADRLRFVHPSPDHYSLTVLTARPEDSGLYSCEVEEWLPSLSDGWRTVAKERSGHLIVNVQTDGNDEEVSEPQCMSGTWIGIFVVYVIISLVLMAGFGLIVNKKCQRKASGGKPGPDLWAENHPLDSKPGLGD